METNGVLGSAVKLLRRKSSDAERITSGRLRPSRSHRCSQS